jgi:PiT family inorganic phosphate transporter
LPWHSLPSEKFWAAFFNFIAFLFFGLHVAQTVGTGIITPDIIDDYVIFGALMGAISWNLLTWALGIPSSSSHALIGGLVGAGIAKAGIGTVIWSGVIKTGSAIVFSPALGFVLALFLILAVSWIFVRRTPLAVDNIFRSLQFVSASFYSLGHGGNDAQKTMGIIAVLLFSHGKLGGEFHVPFWVVLSCQMAMGLGTLFGGWRIVHTMGSKITKLTPMQGFCAETGGAITLFLATGLGIPVSTTHTITGAIVGVGAARRVSAVRWNIAKNIVVAWVITMPMAGIIAAIFYAWRGWWVEIPKVEKMIPDDEPRSQYAALIWTTRLSPRTIVPDHCQSAWRHAMRFGSPRAYRP